MREQAVGSMMAWWRLVDVLDTWEQVEAGQQYEPPRKSQDGDETVPPQPTTERRVDDCDPHAAALTTHLFNGRPGERDYTPRPRPVLRVTPDF